METLKWRNEFGVNQLISKGEQDLNLEEIERGKSFYMGHDREGRPISYVSVKDHIKGEFSSQSTEKLTVFHMEIGRKLLKDPVESVTVIFDLNGFSLKNMDYQHLKFLINLLQNSYPESLGLALIINAPWLFNGCWFIIKPWLDPSIQNKIHFITNLEHLKKYVDQDNLPKRFQGNLADFNYLPPNEQDQFILSTIRQDFLGQSKATQNHYEASKAYLHSTFEWINSDHNQLLIEQRNKSLQQLIYSYEQLLPYISTQTHYHRTDLINEPIFNITFQNITKTNE